MDAWILQAYLSFEKNFGEIKFQLRGQTVV